MNSERWFLEQEKKRYFNRIFYLLIFPPLFKTILYLIYKIVLCVILLFNINYNF